MAPTECLPYKEPGTALTGLNTSGSEIKACRFVYISGPRTGGGGPGALGALSGVSNLSTDVHDLYQVSQCNLAGMPAVGVARRNAATNTPIGFFPIISGLVLPVIVGENLDAGDLVVTDSEGRAVAYKETASGVAAKLIVQEFGSKGAEEKLRLVAGATGYEGNEIVIEILQPTKASETLKVVTTGKKIVVTPATHATKTEEVGGVTYPEITSTFALVIAAINAEGTAAALVTADNGTTGKTTGSGIIKASAAAYLAGGVSSTGGRVLGMAMDNATYSSSGQVGEIKLAA